MTEQVAARRYWPIVSRWWPFMLVGLAVVLGWHGAVDRSANGYLESALQRTLMTFAVARGTNAAISFLQDADVTVTPVGVGVTVSPGELLDPIDDLIEQLSSLLLLAATSLGIQRIAMELVGSHPIQWLLTTVAVCWGVAAWLAPRAGAHRLLSRLLLAALVLRWLVPAHVLIVQTIDTWLLAPRFDAALTELTLGRDQAQALGDATRNESSEPAPSWSDRILGAFDGASPAALQTRITELAKTLAGLGARVVELMVVFSLQTLVLPLAFVWLSSWMLRVILRFPAHASSLARS